MDYPKPRRFSNNLIKRLYAESGGQCSLLGCSTTSALPNGTNLLDVANIRSVYPGGPRFDPMASNAEVASYENAMLVCPAHHAAIDGDPATFTADVLVELRRAHLERIAALLLGQQPPQANRLRQGMLRWGSDRGNDKEAFWQTFFKERPELLLPASAGRPYVVNSQAYVGGKSVSGSGSNLPDFVAQCAGNVVLIEIKTPATHLVGSKYRSNAFPPSRELAGACVQALEYRTSLMNNLHSLSFHGRSLFAPNPIAVVIAGDTQARPLSEQQRRSFEIFRHSLKDVTVLTYDELFESIGDLAAMMEDS